MAQKPPKFYITLALAALLAWLFLRWGLPILLPFFLGAGLALAAEPVVGRLSRHLPRVASAAIGVTLVLAVLLGLLVLGVALLVREAGRLASVVPRLAQTARQGMDSLELWLLDVAEQAPGDVGNVLTNSVTGLFSDGSAWMDRLVSGIVGVATNVLGGVPDSAMGFGTGILAAYMISIRLPRLRQFWRSHVPGLWRQRLIPALSGMKRSLLGYLTAQCKLMAVTFAILVVGFFLLQIKGAVLWAAVIALVDAIPVLGTGTVLLPWALVCLLQGNRVRAVGLLGVYAVAWLSRSVLEPKLLGRELGLDPLLTLLSMYGGYRFFGFPGLILAPVAAVAIFRLVENLKQAPSPD